MRISDWSSDVCSSDLIAGGDRPFGGALGLGHPLGELEGGGLLFGRAALEDVEIAAAGRRAAPLAGRQHGGAELELGILAEVGQVAGGDRKRVVSGKEV